MSSAMPSRSRARGQRGIALVVVLWIVTLLALQVSIFNLTVRDAASLAGNEMAAARGEALAAGGVELAAARLAEREISRRWQANGGTQTVAFGGARLQITITDESSRFDINEIGEELLASLLRPYAGTQATLAAWVDRVLDWRDTDSDRRPQGAEDQDYRRAGLPYGPRNGPFLDPSELGRVLGMPASVAEALARTVTVYGGEGKINPALAPREALMLLPGVDAGEIDQALQLRSQGRGTSLGGPGNLPALARWFTARVGPTFRIAVVVRDEATEGAIGKAEAVILVGRDAATPFRVLSWRYGSQTPRGQGGQE
jgi:general secretion pathway protein K